MVCYICCWLLDCYDGFLNSIACLRWMFVVLNCYFVAWFVLVVSLCFVCCLWLVGLGACFFAGLWF